MLFQMFYALYACREKLALRHFDIKLLNFFVTKGLATLTNQQIQALQSTLGANGLSDLSGSLTLPNYLFPLGITNSRTSHYD